MVGPNLPSGVAFSPSPFLAPLAFVSLGFGLLQASAVCLAETKAERSLQEFKLKNQHLQREFGGRSGIKSLIFGSVQENPLYSLSGSSKGLRTGIFEGQTFVGKQWHVSENPTGGVAFVSLRVKTRGLVEGIWSSVN